MRTSPIGFVLQFKERQASGSLAQQQDFVLDPQPDGGIGNVHRVLNLRPKNSFRPYLS